MAFTLFIPSVNFHASAVNKSVSRSRWSAISTSSKHKQHQNKHASKLTVGDIPMPTRVAAFLERAREGNPKVSLKFAERKFEQWKNGTRAITQVVFDERDKMMNEEDEGVSFDVVVAGGTLGIFYACALAALGLRVAVVEMGSVKGRKQEWNISRAELHALVRTGVLTQAELNAAIVNEFSAGSKVRLPGVPDITVHGVLDIGVDPSVLVAAALARFIQLGGQVFEYSLLERVSIRESSLRLTLRPQQKIKRGDGALGAGGTSLPGIDSEGEIVVLRSRLLVDAMGAFSPIAAQSRGGVQPDGACITVGSCLSGKFESNASADLLASFDGIDILKDVQYFWEAFPAGRELDRRTTYMFSYGKCDSDRQTLTQALDDYIRMLPRYQSIDLDKVNVERVLFAFFPCYRKSPARLKFDRILPVGDAGGFQSPISFGGFGACLRHLQRVTSAVQEAVAVEDDSLLKRNELQLMQFYSPSLAVTWLFNHAMQAHGGGDVRNRQFINQLLAENMHSMNKLGSDIMKPFLQDVVTADGLTKTLTCMTVRNPVFALQIASHVGFRELGRWGLHYLALLVYTLATPIARALRDELASVPLNDALRYRLNRIVDACEYGSGLDHEAR